MARKPQAADRTVDMFTGKTKLEEVQAAQEDVAEAPKPSETIEQAAERWRANAFWAAEYFSKSWGDNHPAGRKYRLTSKDGRMLLESFTHNGQERASAWTGVMFPDTAEDLYELTSLFVRASKERLALSLQNTVSLPNAVSETKERQANGTSG